MSVKHEVDVQSLWAKYEDIAMHFNNLLMRLRSQSLAGIAAISAVVGIFAKKDGTGIHLDWVVAQAIFSALAVLWVALWFLDFFYYNRLLTGAVAALRRLEDQTKAGVKFDGHIEMSTLIEAEFLQKKSIRRFDLSRFGGVAAFYLAVLMVILGGVVFSAYMRGVL